MPARLIVHCSQNTTHQVLSVFQPLLRPEEYAEAFHEVYEKILTGILTYDELRRRELKRLAKGENETEGG